ncbi:hypothetical protein BH09GEM1_BH09GEM1_21060 [soil metagenome]
MRRFHQQAVIVAIVTLACASAPAGAQRGTRGTARGEYPQGGGGMAAIRVAPPVVALVLDHAGDFKLSDTQRSVLESVRHTQDSTNRPWMLKLDSLRPTSMPANGMNDLSQEQRDEIEARKVAVANVIEGMRENNAEARKKVMATLNPDQQQRAAVLEDEAKKKLEEESKRRERSGPPGGGGGGSRGGRGRPPED